MIPILDDNIFVQKIIISLKTLFAETGNRKYFLTN